MTDRSADAPLRAAARAVIDYEGPVPSDLGVRIARLEQALAATPSTDAAAPGLDVERLQAAMERVAYLQSARQGRFQERARRVFAEAIAREYNAIT